MGWIANTAFDVLMQRLQLERSDPKGAAAIVEIAPHAVGPTPYLPPTPNSLQPIMGRALGGGGGPMAIGAPGGSVGGAGGQRMIGGPTAGRAVPPPPSMAGGANQYVAIADFATGEPGDLDVRAGDIIIDVEEVDENWYRGRIGQTVGIFPKTYAQRSGAPRRF
ncbi:hypothetical protein SmJEL517_g02489 [Synchytrium microbalum]|uniref:SH3 domain-containing protein n=1 Tax=Synchytrium microbalum TaxID=1806994 RepID=A0A507CBY7_9FUNG|nr:uncharacterized protein SmJEL517_g02489 [Synchytrium microbalum]TPX35075.1 hypothetical protein SmJEL517_g02489 [Synchytrium microbalum]